MRGRRACSKGGFYHPDGKAHFHAVTYRPPAEDIDDAYPVLLTTGRVVSQYLSGTQTRRIGPLVQQYPEPLLEIHPELATRLDVQTGDLVRVASRRASVALPCQVVRTIGPIRCLCRTTGQKSARKSAH